jgi:hypothetical protein
MDGSPETLESGEAQLYSVSYLLTADNVNAGRVDIRGRGTAEGGLRLIKAGLILSTWLASLILSFTSFLAVLMGVLTAYGAVSGILHLFGHHSRPQAKPQPVLVAHGAQAGAD